MKKILLLTASLFLAIGAMAQTPIQSGLFDANKLYRIYNKKTETNASNNDAGYMAISVNDAKTQGVMKAYDANDESQIWKFVADGDNKYKLLNVLTGKYLGAVAPSAIPNMVDEASATSYGMVVNSDNKFSFWHTSDAHSSNAEKGRWLWNDGGGKLCGWYAEENPWHLFYLEEAKTVTPEELLAAREAFDVAYAIAKENIDASDLIYQKGDDLPLQTTAENSPYYIWTNAQEQSEGPISQLVDGKVENKNFFHTTWNNPPAGPHYIEVDLGENNDLAQFVISYSTRINSDGQLADFPDAIEILGCNEKNGSYTRIATLGGNLPQAQGQRWESAIVVNEGFRFLRFNVSAERTYWHMAEFDITRMNASIDDMYKGVFDEVVALKAVYERMADNADYGYAQLVAATKALNEAIAAVVYTLNVTEAGYATMYLAHNAIIPDFDNENGVYIVKSAINGWAQMEKVTGILPANTGVVVKGKGNYKFVYTQENATANVEGNLLEGTVTSEPVEGEAYVLGIPEDETEVALCKAKLNLDATGNNAGENGTHFLNNANKAYLPASLVSGASLSANLRFDFGGTTAIEEVETEVAGTVIYDLVGRRVNEITKAGVYVVNGKKVLVK